MWIDGLAWMIEGDAGGRMEMIYIYIKQLWILAGMRLVFSMGLGRCFRQ